MYLIVKLINGNFNLLTYDIKYFQNNQPNDIKNSNM